MKYNLTTKGILSLVKMFLLAAFVFTITSGFTRPRQVLPVGNVPDNIKTMLADYSQQLNIGETSRPSFYSGPMAALIQERRNYYREFYSIGMHTNLISINSMFSMETAQVIATTDTFHIELEETVTTFGYPNFSQSDDYPMIPAARWAISNTENENVKQALERYITSTTNAVNYSISNGAETTFRIHHSIDISLKGGQPQFTKDEFTDREIDNENGVDNVSWVKDGPVRTKPDFTRMFGYKLYHTPIDVLGKQLLDDYIKSDGGPSPLVVTSSFTYGRTSASNYAYTYVGANVSKTCTYGGTYYMDTSYYNQLAAYKNVWTYTTQTCNDCADYISQALRQGGFPTDTIWNFTPSPGTYGWRVSGYSSSPQGLFYWLDNTWGATTQYASAGSLQLGDLITDSYYPAGGRNHGAGHVVMVTQIGAVPYFSGHTNDRKNAYLGSFPTLQYFWHIADNLFH